jgi:CHAT domain-containing protein
MPDGRLLCERFRVSYAPSLAYFLPAPSIAGAQSPSVAVLLNSQNGLQGPMWELERLRRRVDPTTLVELDGFEGDDRALLEALASRDVIHVATHAALFTHTPELSGIELRQGRMLTLSAIERFTLKPGCLVFLNACESSRVAIRSRIEFSSIANAFLSAGAATVIATFWEAEDTSAALLSDLFYRGLLAQRRGPLESLNAAIRALQDIDLDELSADELGPLAFSLPVVRKQPYRNPSYWGQYALFGRW